MGRRVAIVGVGLTKCSSHRKDVTYPELVHEAVSGALADAGVGFEQIDAVVYGSMDPFDGVFAPERWCVDSCVSAGFLNKPFLKITTGGTTGGSTALGAYYHVGSGMFDVVLAVASQRVGETIEAQLVLNTAVDPIYERWIGAGAITIAANQASNHFNYYGTTEEDLAMVAAKNYANALNNPYAHLQRHLSVEDALRSRMISWPLRLSDCCPSSDGACAIIFASEKRARQIAKQPAWVRGAGQITDNYFAGDRPWFHDWDSLAMLARRVYKQAKISEPMAEIQVAEPYVAFSVQELMEYEALGFAEPGRGAELIRKGVTAMGGKVPFCPSGGTLCTNPIGATGLIRVAEAALQVMDKADKRQVPNVKTALAHSWGAVIGFHTMMILDKEAP
ncbi:MAG TPA: thiolase family protein [Dehalococcoidia bacterium]|nr:thiolase family protein [Dehalococcoidia bacterium]